MRKTLLLALIALFLCVSVVSRADAYQDFSYNNYFDNNTGGGFVAYTQNSNPFTAFTWCASCVPYGSGMLLINNTFAGNDTQYVFAINHSDVVGNGGVRYTDNITDITVLGSLWDDIRFSVPANTEVISTVRYVIEGQPTLRELPELSIWCDGESPVYVQGETDWQTWWNMTVILPSANHVRECQAYFKVMQYSGSQVYLDYFKVFTFDLVESRDPLGLFLNETQERELYCGAGSAVLTAQDLNPIVTADSLFGYSNGTGFMLAKSDLWAWNSIDCSLFILNGTVIARRGIFEGFDYYTKNIPFLFEVTDFLISTRDPLYMQVLHLRQYPNVTSSFLKSAFLISKMTLSSMQATNLYFPSDSGFYGSGVPDVVLKYNGVPINYLNITLIVNSSAFKSDINTLPYSSQPYPAGLKWTISPFGSGWNTSKYFNFFDSDLNVLFPCAYVGYVCDNLTNYEHYVTSGCDNIGYAYCGDAGCNMTTNRCVAPCSGSHWSCNGFEAWHYNSLCVNDLQVLCGTFCNNATGQCDGEINCVSNSECANYCDGSNLLSGGTCNLGTYSCSYSSQACPNGCSAGACLSANYTVVPLFDNNDMTPLGVVSTITGGLLSFLNVTGVPIFNIIFWMFVIVIIISVFSLIAHLIKSGFG